MAILNANTFALNISKFAKEIPEELIVDNLKSIVIDLMERIVPRTPIKTGRARHNWRVAIGKIPSTELLIPDPVGVAKVVVNQIKSTTTAVYIVNNVPYIGFLEDGHSKQAPLGMVAISFEEVANKYK